MGLIGRVWAEIGGNADGLKKAVQEGKDALKSIGTEAQSASTQSTNALSGFAAQAAMVIGGIAAALKIAQETFDLAAEGAQIASLEQASIKLANSYDTSMTAIVKAVQTASFETITEYDAMKAANLAMTMGVSTNANEIANLIQIAIERGRAFGLTTDQAFSKIVTGIGRQSPKVLDDLGFSIRGASGAQEYLNLVLEQGNAELAKQGGLMMDVSTPYQQATTKISQTFQDIKKSLAYGFLDLFASPEEVAQINRERASIALTTGDYQEYKEATIDLAQAQGKQAWQMHILTEEQFKNAQSIKAQASVMGMTAETIIKEKSELYDLDSEMALSIGLSGDLATAQQTYAEAMKKAGGSTQKQQAAIDDLNESYEDFILNTLQSLEVSPEATMGIAYAFGEIDDSSLAVFGAINKINEKFEVGSNDWIKALENVKNKMGDLAGLQIGDKSATITIYIRYLTSGILSAGQAAEAGRLTGQYNQWVKENVGGMHGGSFVGLAHGGIVPPGFSNDGMPLMVSSGERVDVTPAGNKSVENEQLAGMINELLFAIRGLPRDIRDAVQMVS